MRDVGFFKVSDFVARKLQVHSGNRAVDVVWLGCAYDWRCDLGEQPCERHLGHGDAARFSDFSHALDHECVGVGRVMLALQCVCKRLAHLGVHAHYVGEITEPHLNPGDLLIVGSGSGASLFPLGIAKKARAAVDCRIVHIGSNPNSEMKEIADFMVRIPVRTKFYLEDEIDSCQPMTSLFEQSVLLLGDILAKMIIEEKGIVMKDLWAYHANLE